MMTRTEVTVGGRRARVWTGGRGEPLVLVHGAWGGAELHWAPLWEALAARFFVIAPDLPGIGDLETSPLPSIDAYADWLAALLNAVGGRRSDGGDGVWCLGNSLGAAVAWQLSARLGARCRGLVLVNGPPPRPAPALVRLLAAILSASQLRALYRRLSFSPPVLARAFADPARAPAALRRVLASPPPAQLDALLALIVPGAVAAPRPAVPLLLAWGAADRLPGTGAAAARALRRSLPGAELVLLPAAGHCPQLEQPAAFAAALFAFAAASAAPSSTARAS